MHKAAPVSQRNPEIEHPAAAYVPTQAPEFFFPQSAGGPPVSRREPGETHCGPNARLPLHSEDNHTRQETVCSARLVGPMPPWGSVLRWVPLQREGTEDV